MDQVRQEGKNAKNTDFYIDSTGVLERIQN